MKIIISNISHPTNVQQTLNLIKKGSLKNHDNLCPLVFSYSPRKISEREEEGLSGDREKQRQQARDRQVIFSSPPTPTESVSLKSVKHL